MASKSNEALPTQQFVEVSGTKNGVLILKNGSLRQILAVSGLNFDLKSEDEQEAITYAYQSFLNTLDFSIQIFIHSRKINVEGYIDSLAKLVGQETNPLLKTQISEYREFIRSFTTDNAIMSKSYFVVVPFDVVNLPVKGGKSGFLGIFGKTKPRVEGKETAQEATLTKNISQLSQRTESVVAGLNQIGLRAVAINDDEATELFYNLYNPDAIEKKGMELGGAGSK
ncbi:MAG: hypothetical protein COU10_02310 [Candidatus Harrisonbacteria bacterium CG10_big_fil_rev_8_21_14_0_10_45_28]|uniref:TraC-like domain-containing protein n=1 Tax=Candidatus Harrisonbacteria bacterium CG10_big_fil_rev_8_21_14_0_10_45_28 TaxID=1974586 RepID=A0A2H0UN51_9BACT|nr:MAG: hypothetical protein COU10_02310 [Candidatus Harrisonbacteria bacterium CG10_big_fil_rev_8_21_14_0_10_45_28]